MALNAKSFQLLESNYQAAQRMRFMLASLYGANVDVNMRAFLLQANEEEMACWVNIQKAFYSTKGNNLRLKELADKASLEFFKNKAYEEGRSYAYKLPPEEVSAEGVVLRETKNPYRHNEAFSEEVKNAWSDGFQSSFEVISGESW